MGAPYDFVIRKFATFKPPNDLAVAGTDFMFSANIEGEIVQFNFSWNGYKQYYSLDILRADNRRIFKWYPTANEYILVRNFNETDPDIPDAMIAVVDTTGEELQPRPSLMGKSHLVSLFLGEVRRA